MVTTRFEWDPAKAESNLRKHGVSFESAQLAFRDPFAITFLDRIEGGESRWLTIGMIGQMKILAVAHADREKTRMATPSKSSASSRPVRQSPPRDVDTKTNLVSFDVDLANLPPLTEEQKAELAALEALPDEAIDTSDIPVMPDIETREFVRGKYYRPTQTATTVRIDSDVLAWLRDQGPGYQTRLNAILRREMLAALKKG